MIFVSCDPGPSNCAVVVIEACFEIDLTGDTLAYKYTDTFKVLHSQTLSLVEVKAEQKGIPGMTAQFLQHLSDLDTKYKFELGAVEDQGYKHGINCLPINVENNAIQGSFFGYFYGLQYGCKQVNPYDWKAFHKCHKTTKTISSYQKANLLSQIINRNKLQTVHEWDSAMIGLTSWYTRNDK